MNDLEIGMATGIIIISILLNIIQHYHMDKLLDSHKKWEEHAKELQSELVKKTKFINDLFDNKNNGQITYKTWRKDYDENNDI